MTSRGRDDCLPCNSRRPAWVAALTPSGATASCNRDRPRAPASAGHPTAHAALASQIRANPRVAWRRRSDGKVGRRCCVVGESGVVWRPAIDRSGGAPPTPPLRSDFFLGHAHWRFEATSSIRWTRRTGSASRPGFALPSPTGRFSPRTPRPASRSGRPRLTRAIIERALGGLNPMGAAVPQAEPLLPGQLVRDRPGRERAGDAAAAAARRTRRSRRRSSSWASATTSRSGRARALAAPSRRPSTREIGEVTERLGNPS